MLQEHQTTNLIKDFEVMRDISCILEAALRVLHGHHQEINNHRQLCQLIPLGLLLKRENDKIQQQTLCLCHGSGAGSFELASICDWVQSATADDGTYSWWEKGGTQGVHVVAS
jgi:hypothetical protein